MLVVLHIALEKIYFGEKCVYHDRHSAPHKVCYVRVYVLKMLSTDKHSALVFHWYVGGEEKCHCDNCLFCSYDVSIYKSKNLERLYVPKSSSVLPILLHGQQRLSFTNFFED